MPQKRKSNAANKNSRGKGNNTGGRGTARQATLEERTSSPEAMLRNDVTGVVLAVMAVIMFISLVYQSNAVLTEALSRGLTQSFGLGAFLCPVALLLFSFTFFMNGEEKLSKRVAGGLLLIVVAVLALISLNVAGAEASPDLVLDATVAPVAGGYVGGFVAWVLLALVGRMVGNAVLAGLIVVGVVVCGFSISRFVSRARMGLVEARENLAKRHAEHSSRGAGKDGGEPDAPNPQDLPWDDAPADGEGQATTFIGSRKTTVLKRGGDDAAADSAGSADQSRVAGSAYEDSVVTRRWGRNPHPDLDTSTATPAQTAEEAQAAKGGRGILKRFGSLARRADGQEPAATQAEGQGVEAGVPAASAGQAAQGSATPSARQGSPLAGASAAADQEAGETAETGQPAGSTGSVAVPDFLLNPKNPSGRNRQSQPNDTTGPGATGARGATAKRAAGAQAVAPVAAATAGAVEATTKTRKRKTSPSAAAKAVTRPGDGDETYELPPLTMLSSNPMSGGSASSKSELDQTMDDLQETLEEFGLRCHVVDYVSGPLVTTFRIEMGEGERVNKIKNLEDDIALTLAAEKVRIYAPIPGTSYVGVEIPNKTRQNVHLGDVLPYAKGGPLEVAIGRDSAGKPVVADIAKMPHMLVAGTTGSGKSVMINSMIMSLLMRTTPKQVRLIMIDPKRVEFSGYNGLPHLYVPVVTEPRQAASALQWAVSEMERRLKVFERAGARNIKVYNRMCVNGKLSEMDNPPEPMPYIVIIIDELSDLMMVAGKDVEASIVRIAQLARAAGIHLIIATQRPSANVVTGLIKSNIDTRAALKVSSGIDSRVILDETGAERLLGNGDMLFKDRGLTPRRVLGCYTSDNEIEEVVSFIRDEAEPDYHEEILTAVTPNTPGSSGGSDVGDEDDPLVWEAAQIVVESQLGSTSGLQRRLKVGYARAGRIMDMLAAKGVVGPPDGSKPREVLLDQEGLDELRAQEAKYREVG